jgi:tagatose-6-phosphate ketose/aldose isomerase
LRAWIADQSFDEVWFCGAGTSAYIGDIIAASIKGTRSVPSTDIVANPAHVLSDVRPLVVNFGRSGNSTESIGTLGALDALAPDAPSLNITCNKEGALATRTSDTPSKLILLPDAAHDEGFAMTSSFSTMLLTGLALFDASYDVPTR